MSPNNRINDLPERCRPQKVRRHSRNAFFEPILMMKPAENGSASNRMTRRNKVAMSALRWWRTQCTRDPRPKAHMRTHVVEMRNPSPQDEPEMTLVEKESGSPGIRGVTSRRNVRTLNSPWVRSPVFATLARPWRLPVCPVPSRKYCRGRELGNDTRDRPGAPPGTVAPSIPLLGWRSHCDGGFCGCPLP